MNNILSSQTCLFMCTIHTHVNKKENLTWKRKHRECRPLIIQLIKLFFFISSMYGLTTGRVTNMSKTLDSKHFHWIDQKLIFYHLSQTSGLLAFISSSQLIID